ncbi:MAG: polyprenyl synthetase family protein [Halioglobus sp.]|nr:polyprenyl synthetase family protein [Halioglobus sp.]
MSALLPDLFKRSQARTADALRKCLQTAHTDQPVTSSSLSKAIEYSVASGGKGVRPALLYAAATAVGCSLGDPRLDGPACAVELVHTYSLIHDDLPAMDDDDLRRGRPSMHKAFDEATAILVGDGLQAKAFELLATDPTLTAGQRIDMIEVLSKAAGPDGMVGGQFIDVKATDSHMSLADLQRMHALKTGALIRAALSLGGIAAEATPQQLQALDQYGKHIGLGFQVVDDILDIAGNPNTLGKTLGKDSEANKPTYVKLLGLKGAKNESRRLLQAALENLNEFGTSADALRELARYIIYRER